MLGDLLQVASLLTGTLIVLACEINIATVLPMRHRSAYLVLTGAGAFVVAALTGVAPRLAQVHFVVCGLVCPFMLLEGAVGERFIGMALCVGLLFAGEFAVTLAMVPVAIQLSFAEVTREWAALTLGCRIFDLAFNICGGFAVRAFMRHHLRGDQIETVVPRFALATLLGVGLAAGLFYIIVMEGLVASDPLSVMSIALSSLVVPLDAGLLWSLERARRAAAADAHARVAGERLEACLARYGRVSRATVRTAQLRHDARAHLQAVSALVAEGDHARAEGYAREMAALLRADDYGAFGLWDADGDAAGEATVSPGSRAEDLHASADAGTTSNKDGDTACSSQA
ncbi:hypothetical protein [Collinsella intestinalis]|uniref:hypothetical protein n=1 Tax=Collinsella intestinalis TaxID=147207 RepID=UPI00195C708A|nr:hypothetical protein [Collinsella intestinalis]MBM6942537.1 hypothetical protein [Collinsella intestinalis]